MSRPIGVDISKWQAHSDLSKPHGVDFVKLHDKADFIILRAGYGGSGGGAWTDERVHDYMKDLEPILLRNPKPFTLYWYFRDDVSVMEQVARYVDVVLRWKEVINLPLVVDAEVFVKSDLVSTQKIIDFQTEVEKATGLKVDILYARAGQLNEETTPGLPAVLPQLFIARYDKGLNPQIDEPWDEGDEQEYVEPRDYDNWVIWQHSASGMGAEYGVVSASIDQDVYHGTLEQLREWAKLDQVVPEPAETKWGDTAIQTVAAIGASGTIEIPFSEDKKTVSPKILTVQCAKGTVTKITVKVVVNGVRVLLRRLKGAKYVDYFKHDFDIKLDLNPGDKVLVTLDGVPNATASVKYIYEVWF